MSTDIGASSKSMRARKLTRHLCEKVDLVPPVIAATLGRDNAASIPGPDGVLGLHESPRPRPLPASLAAQRQRATSTCRRVEPCVIPHTAGSSQRSGRGSRARPRRHRQQQQQELLRATNRRRRRRRPPPRPLQRGRCRGTWLGAAAASGQVPGTLGLHRRGGGALLLNLEFGPWALRGVTL